MSRWIKVDWDFGLPVASFVVNLRTHLGWWRQVVNISDPSSIEAACLSLLKQHRPELNGATVVTLRMPFAGSMRLIMDVTHSSLLRVGQGYIPPTFLLERCATCGKDMSDERLFVNEDGQFICGEQCLVKPEIVT